MLSKKNDLCAQWNTTQTSVSETCWLKVNAPFKNPEKERLNNLAMKDNLLFIQAHSFSLPECSIPDSDQCPLKAGNSAL